MPRRTRGFQTAGRSGSGSGRGRRFLQDRTYFKERAELRRAAQTKDGKPAIAVHETSRESTHVLATVLTGHALLECIVGRPQVEPAIGQPEATEERVHHGECPQGERFELRDAGCNKMSPMPGLGRFSPTLGKNSPASTKAYSPSFQHVATERYPAGPSSWGICLQPPMLPSLPHPTSRSAKSLIS
jgi:hypothetical protein